MLWQHRQRAHFTTAALTTAGGVLFAGDFNRYIKAFDVKSGKLLWQTRAPTSGQGFPLSYAVRGRQYIAVPLGIGATWSGTRSSWEAAVGTLTPEITRPRVGNALLVFALPQASPGTSN